MRLADGLPPPVATDYTNPSGSIIGVAQDFKSTRVQQFNLIVEKEFAGNVVAAGYVGSRGDNVAFVVGDINLAPIGAGHGADAAAVQLTPAGRVDDRHVRERFRIVLQRDAAGVPAPVSRWALVQHQLHAGPQRVDAAAAVGRQQVERFDADNDVRHRVTAAVNYELPFGRDLTGLAQQVLGGWQINAVASWQTGLPFNITNATARVNTGGGDRPNLVGEAELDDPAYTRWFNTAAFAAQPINTIGDTVVARNFLHGPSQRRLDLSLFKDFMLPRNARLQLRVEAYNVTNAVNFANPNGALGNAAFGTITSTNGTPRQMQFALKLLF